MIYYYTLVAACVFVVFISLAYFMDDEEITLTDPAVMLAALGLSVLWPITLTYILAGAVVHKDDDDE